MTRKCNGEKIPFILLLFLTAGLLFSSYAEDSSSTKSGATNWVVAAEKFQFTQKNNFSETELSFATMLPQLILDQFSSEIERIPPPQERLDRTLYSLRKKRTDLFLQLSKESLVRDSLVLEDTTDRELAVKIKEENKKIDDLRKQIDDNLDQVAREQEKAAAAIERDEERNKNIEAGKIIDDTEQPDDQFKKMLKAFVRNDDEPTPEQLKLYKDDFTQLFDAGKSISYTSYKDRTFETAVTSAGINALITGKITLYDNYLSVTTELYQYPGARMIGTAYEVGGTSDLRFIAVSIAHQLYPKIADSMPVALSFSLAPEGAASEAVIAIDGVVYRSIPERLIVQTGVHSILFSANGYQSAGISYAFRGSRSFKISVTMQPDKPGTVSFSLKKPLDGFLFANGEKINFSDDGTARIQVNGQPVLGEFITDDGSAAPFYIQQKLAVDGNSLAAAIKLFDRSDYIENRRKIMYATFSLLIVSCIPTFYTYGTFNAEYYAYKNGYGQFAKARDWQKAAQISAGITAGCAALVVFELVRYLHAADTVLPAYARKQKIPAVQKNAVSDESDETSMTEDKSGSTGAAENRESDTVNVQDAGQQSDVQNGELQKNQQDGAK